MKYHIPSLIEKKREGGELTQDEISSLINGYTLGEIADYQMSAMAMAIFFRSMTDEEITYLTRAMLDSGESFQHPDNSPPKVDKHSTGGIGDKVSLILAPLLACDGLWVPMISGRGLGITGGTLDKLESIPGFNVNLPQKESLEILQKINVVMIGQTADICPADKKLYALRDVTGTVPSRPLITASIMSKKLAESLDRLVLDVKYGSGAFMKTKKEAEELSSSLTRVGKMMGVDTHAILTPMDEPLGHAVGNALEVQECIDAMHGNGPTDLVELTLDLCETVSNSDKEKLRSWLHDGTAWNKFVEMVDIQNGDAACLDDYQKVHPAPVIQDVIAETNGTIETVHAETIGRASVILGAGRQKASDPVDPRVGFDRIAKIGDKVDKGDILLRIHAADQTSAATARESITTAIKIS